MVKFNAQAKHLVEAKGPGVEGISPSELIQGRRYKYLVVNVLSRRARELNRGERARAELPDPHTNAEIAMAANMSVLAPAVARLPVVAGAGILAAC